MQTTPAIKKLKALEPRLREQGVSGLYLFGSLARGEQSHSSDIDLMFDIMPGARFSIFDQARITREIEELLATKIDFVPRRSLHPMVRERAEAEGVKVFDS